MKVLVKKSFNFVGEIWRAYVQSRINDLRCDIYITDIASTIITSFFVHAVKLRKITVTLNV